MTKLNDPDAPWNKTKPYKDYPKVDFELDEDILDRLNAIPGISVSSVCSGHPRGGLLPINAGGKPCPEYFINIEKEGFAIKKESLPTLSQYMISALRAPDCKVDFYAWGGPSGKWVVWSNDVGWKKNPFNQSQNPKDYPVSHVWVVVRSTIEHTGKNQKTLRQWWERAVTRLENTKPPTVEFI